MNTRADAGLPDTRPRVGDKTASEFDDWKRYLALRPGDLPSALRLLMALGIALVVRVSRPARFRGIGEYVWGVSWIRVKVGSLHCYARPRSEDLHYLLPDHKPTIAKWLKPMPGDRVVDVGAHVGLYALRAAAAGAYVIAIEPNPSTLAVLRANVRANNLANVEVWGSAIGDGESVGTLEVPETWDGKASLVPGWALGGRTDTGLAHHEVAVRPLDQILDIEPLHRIDWLLIDVEGSEVEALVGAAQSLARTEWVLIETSLLSTSKCKEILEGAHGFRIVSEEPQTAFTRYLVAHRDSPSSIPRRPGS